ncbi:MAG: heme ABC exporter ATP-binding protein CcmA [Pseudomonadota bacterium]
MSLRATDLICARGGVPVLQGLSFEVTAGKALILRGPNGSGKTTLLRTLAGLQPPVSGEIERPEGGLAYGGHADAVKAALTVAENLGVWARIHGLRVAPDVFERFALGALRNRPAGQLSAGQRRRLGLARLAVTGRTGWLLDEPTVSLDSTSVERFGNVVRAHLAAGGFAVLATHIDLGIEADELELGPFRAVAPAERSDFDEAFL